MIGIWIPKYNLLSHHRTSHQCIRHRFIIDVVVTIVVVVILILLVLLYTCVSSLIGDSCCQNNILLLLLFKYSKNLLLTAYITRSLNQMELLFVVVCCLLFAVTWVLIKTNNCIRLLRTHILSAALFKVDITLFCILLIVDYHN